jgi:Ca2+-binding RTX toxin-like protein
VISSPRKPTIAAALATAALLAAAPAALASTATIQSGNRVLVNGPGNEKNQISISFNPVTDTFDVFDVSGVTASGACLQGAPTIASCPAAGIASVRVTAGGAGDTVNLAPGWPATIEGDLDGGSGDDAIWGAEAADSITGNSGRDIIDGRGGADDIRGGSSTDTAYYGDRTGKLEVTVGVKNDNDGNEDDRTGNSLDTVHGDIEAVLAGAGPDVLVGDGSDETLFGGDGDDAIFGGRGKDTLVGFNGGDFLQGDDGNDTVKGGFGPDRVHGGDDSDRVVGGPDGDLVHGGSGSDAMNGKSGIDVLQTRDGTRDRKISCGPGPNGREFARRDRRLDPKPKSC